MTITDDEWTILVELELIPLTKSIIIEAVQAFFYTTSVDMLKPMRFSGTDI
jgi:hypothetical protein